MNTQQFFGLIIPILRRAALEMDPSELYGAVHALRRQIEVGMTDSCWVSLLRWMACK